REPGDQRARQIVDLLPVILSDVADVEVAVGAVERETPRVAQAEGDDLPLRTTAKRIDAEELAEPLVQALRTIAGIPAASAVAHAHIQEPVAIELKLAAVVVRIRLAHEQQLVCGRLHSLPVPRTELHHPRIAALVGVVHVETVIS